jgi:ABC-type glycerol-3-phosphate transport system substrate-binding protein
MKLRPFELALVVIFGILMVLSLILLRTVKPKEDTTVATFGGQVNIWGTLPAEQFTGLLYELAQTNKNYASVSYRYIPEENFDEIFVNALADGIGPDLLFLPHELLGEHLSRIEPVPFTSFPLRDFKSAYIDGAEIFLLSESVYGYPVMVDPLMLYWNRDLFSVANRLTPPSTWEEIIGEVVPELTVKDINRNISQSAIAFGEYDNIKNSFPIISMLWLQGGATDPKIAIEKSLPEVITFYINFNNVSNSLYSWNKSLMQDRESFLGGKLAMYFGYGSEAKLLETRNPNLNFDIASVPQGSTVAPSAHRTYGLFYAFMVPKTAPNKAGAYAVRFELSNPDTAKKIADFYNMAPVYRSTLAVGSNDIYGREIYADVPQARAWLSPSPKETDEIFRLLFSDIAANRNDVYQSADDAILRIGQSY